MLRILCCLITVTSSPAQPLMPSTLRMLAIADDDNVRSFLTFFGHDIMDFFYEGQVASTQSKPFSSSLSHMAFGGTPWGADDHDSFFEFFQFFFRTDDFHALAPQILDHLFIMDDRSIGVDLLTPDGAFYLSSYTVSTARLYAEAESCGLCQLNLPSFILFSSMLICTVSRWPQPLLLSSYGNCRPAPHPSACLSGAISPGRISLSRSF